MNLLGRCSEEGWGCPKDMVTAFEWYWLAAEKGTPQMRQAITARLFHARDPALQAIHQRISALTLASP
jgi:TPR repeat protein